MRATVTRGLKIMAREGITPEEFLRRDFLTDLARIPDLGRRTYCALREHFLAQRNVPNGAVTRGLKILAREGISIETFLNMNPFRAVIIPGISYRTYLALREHFAAQQTIEKKGETA